MLLGVITTYSLADAVGRIALDDGTELRFGASALRRCVPAVGLRVRVEGTAPHPLGGLRALEVHAAEDVASYVAKAEAFARGAASEVQETRARTEKDRAKLAGSVKPDPLSAEETRALAETRRLREERERTDREASARAEVLRREAILLRETRSGTDYWAELLRRAGMGDGDVARIVGHVRPGAFLVAVPSETPGGVATSKLGGAPDLPAGFAWPTYADKALAFVAQLRLAEMPPTAREALALPEDGLLSFFYEADEQPWGFDPSHRGAAKVMLTTDLGSLARVELPAVLSEASRFAELPVRAAATMRLPSLESLDLERDQLVSYNQALEADETSTEHTHLFGGYASEIQGAMERECALVTHGISVGEGWDSSAPSLGPLLARAAGYRLLLQLDSDELMGSAWGDGGRLYFWMHEDDLRAKRFDASWCILQCF
jgi:uncharacterized protein YwqG